MIDYNNDIRLNILTVAEKCSIEYKAKPSSHGRYDAICPFCNENKKSKYKLSLTVENGEYKNRFHCHKCGESGTSVSLYAKMKGLSNKEAYKDLIKENSTPNAKSIEKKIIESKRLPVAIAPTDIEKLNKTYAAFLGKLKLSQRDIKDLTNRGLDINTIARKGYKTLPTSYKIRYSITESLIKEGYDIKGVPGFYKDKYNKWTFKCMEGYLIPIRNEEGKICSIQIRAAKKEFEPRYIYFTSSKENEGAKAMAVPHVVYGESTDMIKITEGPLKGDVANYFDCKKTYICLPGVNSGVTELVNILKKLNTKVVTIAFDMDAYTKVEVKKALISLIRVLKENNIVSEIERWDNRFKGIDDYYKHICNKTISN